MLKCCCNPRDLLHALIWWHESGEKRDHVEDLALRKRCSRSCRETCCTGTTLLLFFSHSTTSRLFEYRNAPSHHLNTGRREATSLSYRVEVARLTSGLTFRKSTSVSTVGRSQARHLSCHASEPASPSRDHSKIACFLLSTSASTGSGSDLVCIHL